MSYPASPGLPASTHDPAVRYIVTDGRKCAEPRGTVYRDGRVIGYAVRKTRIAAGSGGMRGLFWTATLPGSSYPASGGLGTRFRTRGAAVDALRAFDDWCRAHDRDPADWRSARDFAPTYNRGF